MLGTNYYFPVFFYSHGIQCFTICRYFDALSKGETPPVKDRLEFQLGQPLEKPLTQGLLAVLHKQVLSLPFQRFHLIYINSVLTAVTNKILVSLKV